MKLIKTQRELQKALNAKKEVLTEDEIFLSDAYADMLMHMQHGILRNLKNDKGNVILDNLGETADATIAVTDGQDTFINYKHPRTVALNRAEKHQFFLGLALHEFGHRLFSDFKLLAKAQDAVKNNTLYPMPTGNIYVKETLETLQKGTKASENLRKIYHDVFNIIEDGYVNKAISTLCPGYGACLKYEVKVNSGFDCYSLKQMRELEEPDHLILSNLIFFYVVHSYEAYDMDEDDDSIIKYMEELKPYLTKAVYECRPIKRAQLINDAFCYVFHVIKEMAIERRERQKAEAKQSAEESKEKNSSSADENPNSSENEASSSEGENGNEDKNSSESSEEEKPESNEETPHEPEEEKTEETSAEEPDQEDIKEPETSEDEPKSEEEEKPETSKEESSSEDDEEGPTEPSETPQEETETDTMQESSDEPEEEPKTDSEGSKEPEEETPEDATEEDEGDLKEESSNEPSEEDLEEMINDMSECMKDTEMSEHNKMKSPSREAIDEVSDAFGEEDELSANSESSERPQETEQLKDVIDKVAELAVGEEQEQALTEFNEQFVYAAKEMPIHENYKAVIIRDSYSKEAKETYDEVHEELDTIVRRFMKEFEKELKDMQLGDNLTGCYAGKTIDTNHLFREDKRIFNQKKLPVDIPEMEIMVLVDCSGSMSGEKIEVARKTAYITYEFCRRLDIPISIVGHNAWKDIYLHNVADSMSIDGYDKYRVFDLSAGNCNRDGFALRYCLDKLKKSPAQTKVMFIVSDGLPSHFGYGFEDGKADCQDAVHSALKSGISTITAGLGEDAPQIKKVYQEDRSKNDCAVFLDLTDITKLPKAFIKIIKERLLESIA